MIYVGIDEAGYGPLLGPLVVARSVFLVKDRDPASAPPCLWTRLAACVGHAADRAALVRVDDSKRLHAGGGGLRSLEHGVLALLSSAPASLARNQSRQPGSRRSWAASRRIVAASWRSKT